MTEEDRAAHATFCKGLIKDLAPEGDMETQLAQRIATDSWRLNRLSAIEDNLFALGLHKNERPALPRSRRNRRRLITAQVFTRESKQLQLLSLYEQRLNRGLQKNLALLKSLQADRKAQREAAMKEAAALLKLSEMRGVEYSPQKDGFVFSTAEIHAGHRPRTAPPALRRHEFQQIQAPQISNSGSMRLHRRGLIRVHPRSSAAKIAFRL